MTSADRLPESARAVVSQFVDALSSIAPGGVEGVYLTGSLAMDDFHPAKSDIDFLVLCTALPDGEFLAQLEQIHKEHRRRFPAPALSGVYLTRDALHAPRPEAARVLSWHDGRLLYGPFEMAPVSLAELRHCAITFFGPPAGSLPVGTDPYALNRFLHENINTYWTRWINRHASWLGRRTLLVLFPRLTEWAVLGVARQLCTLQTGRIVSKTEAGYYCLEKLPPQFHPVLREAIAVRRDERTYPFLRSYAIRPSFHRAAQTVACVRHIIVVFNESFRLAEESDNILPAPGAA